MEGKIGGGNIVDSDANFWEIGISDNPLCNHMITKADFAGRV